MPRRLVFMSVAVVLAGAGCQSDPRIIDQGCQTGSDCVLTTGMLTGRLIAVGVTGATAVREVGMFLDTSPIGSTAPFASYTAPGQVLDPTRLLVASASNYGAPLARTDQLPGSIVSIDPNRPNVLSIPPSFAIAGDQATTLDGSVRLYSAQTANFRNSIYHPDAITANYTSVSNPLGISINNAFGRPWFANAPGMDSGEGTVTVTDPDGRPLAAVVDQVAGGVFAGAVTNRPGQTIEGSLSSEGVGTALLGPSPDGSQKAVFAAVNADGSLSQVHVKLGVDALAPAGLIQSIQQEITRARTEPTAPITHAGVLFSWIPEKKLFIADPLRDSIVLTTLGADGSVFNVAKIETFTSKYLNVPVDLAPAIVEIASPLFSSGTTLAGGSDLYVLNRGDGTVIRMTQTGQVIAVRSIDVPGAGVIGPNQLNGIATSTDASRIWITLSAMHPDFPDQQGMIIEVHAFGAHR